VTVRVGIVGCGLIGFIHSYTLRLLTSCGVVDAAVVATYDADRGRAESFAAAHDAVVCADVDELVDRVGGCSASQRGCGHPSRRASGIPGSTTSRR